MNKGVSLGRKPLLQKVGQLIGNYADAKTAFKISKQIGTRPKGWRLVGQGGSREVWLSPDKVCYKVSHDSHYSYQNHDEIRNYRRLSRRKSLPPNMKIPQTNMYSVRHSGGRYPVIAMEYIKGVHPKDDYTNPIYDELEDKLRVGDLFYANVKVMNKVYYVVDMGEYLGA